MILVRRFRDLLAFATKPCNDEDIVDRLNNKFASYIMIGIGLMLFQREYGSNPLTCWQSPTWRKSWIDYAQDYCFIEGTYYVPVNESYGTYENLHKYKKLNFYQWTPFIFALLGVVFTFPRSFWSFINWSSCLHMNTILSEAKKPNTTGVPTKEFYKNIISHMSIALNRKHRMKNTNFMSKFWINNFSASYLSFCYMFIKVLNLSCVLFTLLVIPKIIAHEDSDFLGFKSIADLVNGLNWRQSELFPRVTACTFKIREVDIGDITQLKSKVVQCVLTTNRLIEKAYYFMWFGLILLLVANILNIIRWSYLLTAFNRRHFLQNIMKASCELAQPTIEWDKKYERKVYYDLLLVQNRILHLENVLKDGNEEEIEAAEKKVEEAKKILKNVHRENKSKRAWKRQEFLENIVDENVHHFVDYIGPDGFLTLRLLYANAGSMKASAVAASLFWKFLAQEEESETKNINTLV